MSSADDSSSAPGVNWSRRIVVALVLVALLVVLALIGSAFLPRWWAQQVGDRVDGSIAAGTAIGLFYGFVFTLLPLVAIWLGFRYLGSWRWRAGVVVVAVLLAAPNLMTLGIVLGTGSGAHAGERILDVEAPAFRGATLGGVLIAVVLVAVAWYLISSRRRAHRRADALQEASAARTTSSDL